MLGAEQGRATLLPDFGPLCAFFFVRPSWETINQTQAWGDIYDSGVTGAASLVQTRTRRHTRTHRYTGAEHVVASVESRLTALSGDEFEAVGHVLNSGCGCVWCGGCT